VGDRVLVVFANPAGVAQADTEQLAFEAHSRTSLVRARLTKLPHRT
jgi:hypothetical protein